MRAAAVMLVPLIVLGAASVAAGQEEWFLWREAMIPQEQAIWVKYPLLTSRKTREDCLRRLHAELSDTLRRSVPPASGVEGVEGKREAPNVWVYRRLGSGETVLYELRLYCLPETMDPRKKK